MSEKHFLRKGQGAFEYILVLSGVLLVALVSALILRTTASSGGRSVNESFQTHQEQTRFALWAASQGSTTISFASTSAGGAEDHVQAATMLEFVNDDSSAHSVQAFAPNGTLVVSAQVESLKTLPTSFSAPGNYAYSWDGGTNNTLVVEEEATPTPTPAPPAPSCGDFVNESIMLSDDIIGCTGNGLEIGADNVVLDCAGHDINGTDQGANLHGIVIRNKNNVTVKNCGISVFRDVGILVEGANHLQISDNSQIECGGIRVSLSSDDVNITGNYIQGGYWQSGTYLTGIEFFDNPTGRITGNTVTGAFFSLLVNNVASVVAENNQFLEFEGAGALLGGGITLDNNLRRGSVAEPPAPGCYVLWDELPVIGSENTYEDCDLGGPAPG